MRVRIDGGGVAARCCARLLDAAGLEVATVERARKGVPALLIGQGALTLLRDLFAAQAVPPADLPSSHPFAHASVVRRRIVRWGDGETRTMPHYAVAISEGQMLDALGPTAMSCVPGEPNTVIHTIAPLPSGEPRRFGTRRGQTVPVALHDPADADACFMEAVHDGWLFLLPAGPGRGWLLGVGADLAALLADSRLIAPRISPDGEARCFETAPGLATQSDTAAWLAAGSAAIVFDPICGDGTAQAVRGAILASAVVSEIAQGADRAPLLVHYDAMLIAAMRRHLALAGDYYATGGSGGWWRAQAATLADGHRWCTARLGATPSPRFLLEGNRLVPRALAA